MFSISYVAITCPAPAWLPSGRSVATFAMILGLLLILLAGKSLLSWLTIRRLGSSIGLREFFRLNWRGARPKRIAAAEWMLDQAPGIQPVEREVWVSFSLLKVDILKLAAAVIAAGQCGIAAGVGVLGAAALSGYDPVEVVRQARERGLKAIDTKTLNDLTQWELPRADKPI